MKSMGWRIRGELPKHTHLVVAAAPHTSNWDFVVAMAALMGTGVKWSYLMKKEAFFFPFKSLFMRLGGIPIDRSQTEGLIDQVVKAYKTKDKLWLAITPEGTRSKVNEYKTGFLRIAEQAQVPVFIVAWHYPTKEIVLDRIWETTGDINADAEAIREYMNSHFVGKHPHKQ